MDHSKKYLLEDNNIEDDSGYDDNDDEFKSINNETNQNQINSNANDNNEPNTTPLIAKKATNLIFANLSNITTKEKKITQLWLIVFTYLVFSLFEIMGGIYSNSIAWMSDAAHSFSDCLCFLIFIVSIYVTQKGTTSEMSFGFHRGEIIGMVTGVTAIWGWSFWLIFSAIMRMINPMQVNGLVWLWVSLFDLFFHLLMGATLMNCGLAHSISFEYNTPENPDCCKHQHHSNDLSCTNVKDIFSHAIGDAIQSCIIISAGLFIYFFPQYSIADPICTLCFTALVLYKSYKTISGCIWILMEGSPIEFDLDMLGDDLMKVKGVVEVHDWHVWSWSIGKISMSCHWTTTAPQVSLIQARELLKNKYSITHSTIQVELENYEIGHSCNHNIHSKKDN